MRAWRYHFAVLIPLIRNVEGAVASLSKGELKKPNAILVTKKRLRDSIQTAVPVKRSRNIDSTSTASGSNLCWGTLPDLHEPVFDAFRFTLYYSCLMQ